MSAVRKPSYKAAALVEAARPPEPKPPGPTCGGCRWRNRETFRCDAEPPQVFLKNGFAVSERPNVPETLAGCRLHEGRVA